MASRTENCEHEIPGPSRFDDQIFTRAAALFRACSDPERLKMLEILARRETCVSELAEASSAAMSTVSQRLRLLRSEGLVDRRRDGRHMFYSLADDHVADLVVSALEHAEHG